MGVIVAFTRDRDNYQVPLAFAETGELDRFVTDYYAGKALQNHKALGHRMTVGVDPADVTTSWPAFAVQSAWSVARHFRNNLPFPSEVVDGLIGRKAAAESSIRENSGLVIYSGYASAAFRRARDVPKILYEFHPSADIVNRVLLEDSIGRSLHLTVTEREMTSHRLHDSIREERNLATGFIVSSSFTASGLQAAGIPESLIRVVPYGVDVPTVTEEPDRRDDDGMRFLFVGQGVQRKGLHILLQAWQEANLQNATLTIVAYRMDPVLTGMAARLTGVRILGKQSPERLTKEFQSHDVLVLPSLVEGFGLVLLEGLAHGCRLISTENTGLPDLHLSGEIAAVARAGDVSHLAAELIAATVDGPNNGELRRTARRAADQWTWARYRQSIRTAYADLR